MLAGTGNFIFSAGGHPDFGPAGHAQLHRREGHAAAHARYQHALAGLHLSAGEGRPVGREAGQRQRRALLEGEVGWQGPDVFGGQHDVLGEGAGVGHAQHGELAGLGAGVAAPAQAGVDEHAGPHGGGVGRHVCAVGGHFASPIGPQGAGQRDAGVFTGLDKNVAVVEGGGVQLHQNFAQAGRGRGNVAQHHGLVNGIELNGLHGNEEEEKRCEGIEE